MLELKQGFCEAVFECVCMTDIIQQKVMDVIISHV